MGAREPGDAADTGGRSIIQSFSRGLWILSQFTNESRRLSLGEISRRTGIHRATVYRFLNTLETEGYLVREPESKLYHAGPAWGLMLLALGGGALFAEILRDDLSTLAETTSATVALGIRQGDYAQVIHYVSPSRGFVPKLPESNLHPLHATWSIHSTVLLAFADEATKRRMLAVPATQHTEYTLVDPEAVELRLEQIAKEGISYSREEFRLGTCAVGAPVMWRDRAIACLALILPVEHFTEDALPSLVKQLRIAARHMAHRLETM